MLNREPQTYLFYILVLKWGTIISDNGLGNSESTDYVVQNEFQDLISCDMGHHNWFHPLFEILCCYDSELFSIR
jgi:hypothetical protein